MTLQSGQEPTNQGDGTQTPTGQVPTGNTQQANQGNQDGDQGGSWLDTLPQDAQDYIKALRGEAAQHRTNAQSLKASLQQIADEKVAAEEAKLKEAQEWEKLAEKRMAKIAELEADVLEKELAMLRVKIAQEAGLPAELADRLQGDDEKALKKDAKALLTVLKVDPEKPGAGLGTPGVRSSVVTPKVPTTRGVSRKLTTL
jgi:hypothetical protein